MAVKNFVLPAGRRFYQSIRVILKLLRKQDCYQSKKWPLQSLWLTTSLKLTAAETEVEDLVVISDSDINNLEMVVNDFGLLGTHGVLPYGYTEWIAEQIYRHDDVAMKYFLDIFNHRINCMRFDLWRKTNLFVSRELDDNFRYPTIFNAMAGSWTGNEIHPELVGPGNAMLWARRTLANLVRLLQRYFNCMVDIIPFQGAWVEVESIAKGKLGNGARSLGDGLVIGNKYWDIHASFHIRIGPVEYPGLISEYQSRLIEIVQLYVSPAVYFTSEFIISAKFCENKINGKYQLALNLCLGHCPENNHIIVRFSH